MKKNTFRFDPLYRVIDETSEIRIVEGKFKKQFDRIKRINNLGIIPEVFEMAKYPKYEHGLGTIHQIKNLLELANIPEKYKKPLKLSALFLHIGHLAFTYSTEKSVLLACNLGDRKKNNIIKKYVLKRVQKSLNLLELGTNDSEKNNLFSLRSYNKLYKFFSSHILITKYKNLNNTKCSISKEELKIIVDNMINEESDGYKLLILADRADFVQRDALYFGTVRIDISPKHLYRDLSSYNPNFSVNEKKLIEYNFLYLNERFYSNEEVECFSSLYTKILASLLICKNFNYSWLEKYTDVQFKRLICDGYDNNNKSVNLPRSWTKKAKDLFDGKLYFKCIFNLHNICFSKNLDAIDIEYELIRKKQSKRGLLSYPFEKGILLAINYTYKSKYPVLENYISYSIKIFHNSSTSSFGELLLVIKNLSKNLSYKNVSNIQNGLAKQLSWTEENRISNEGVISALSRIVIKLQEENNFVEKFLNSLSGIKSFKELWLDFENQYVWKYYILQYLKSHKNEYTDSSVFTHFIKGFLSLPVKLLQYEAINKFIDQLINELLDSITKNLDSQRGDCFEALWLLKRIRTKRNLFQFFINGLVVIDTNKPAKQQDENEFDVIELTINANHQIEIWIWACSIADDYRSKNEKQMRKLVDHIHEIYPNVIIQSRYVIPKSKNNNIWQPVEIDTGRNYNET